MKARSSVPPPTYRTMLDEARERRCDLCGARPPASILTVFCNPCHVKLFGVKAKGSEE